MHFVFGDINAWIS